MTLDTDARDVVIPGACSSRVYQGEPRSLFESVTDASTFRCPHDGFHSGQARYCPDVALLRCIIVCDACLAEVREIGAVHYRPTFSSSGLPS